ncbi:MAG: Gfo/Idh/MocA family oxidoreductase [Lentisphaerae bacterium]|nr:Gfo/Idh/MocA family oxidoreductase [Lentisphaerota bacterium]MBR2720100.1 Gfo/Idh/MocA family oxidoreductase [Lentisphaeria bacterium]
MEEKKVKVAVIATGNRSFWVVKNLLKDSNGNAEIAAVYDPDPSQMDYFCDKLGLPQTKKCSSGSEAINFPGVEWVMVFAPNVNHKEYILEAFAAGKHVFTEKPLATQIADCQEIFQAHKAHPELLFATGFVLRYAPIYRKAKEILDSGKLGRLLSLEANENILPAHGGYIVCNWRRWNSAAGPHILEKCCHDLDLINWFCGSLPSKVASFAKRDYFIRENQYIADKYGEDLFLSWRDPQRTVTAFSGENDMKDTQASIAYYRNNIIVSFFDTMCNPMPERRMVFHCTEGTMSLELYKGILKYQLMNDKMEYSLDFGSDGHGGGDEVIMKELYEVMCTGEKPKCSGSEGLESAVFALALDEAAEKGTMVDLEPVWKKLDR